MLNAFTRNYEDNSTEAGFQFTFFCDLCQDGFKTTFIESETYKKSSLLRGIRGGARVVGNRHKEHDKAFELAQIEARQNYNRCHNCRQWVCDTDFNEEEGLCVECAPRVVCPNCGVTVACGVKFCGECGTKVN